MRPLPLGDGRWIVPGNRWDLVADRIDEVRPTDRVTVVVPHYDAPEQLHRVLAGLAAQTYPAELLEVVVADDGSPHAPAVPPFLAGTGEDRGAPVRLVRQEDLGFRAAAARNLGAATGTGDVLCFVDQDTVPEPDYLRHLVRWCTLLPDALVVGRRRHADLTGWDAGRLAAWWAGGPAPQELTEPQWLRDGYRWTRDLLDADDTAYRYVISAVLACRRDLFDELGGFDESFTDYGGEDWEFAHRAWSAGAVLVHEPRAVAWHDGPDWAGRGTDEERAAQKDVENRTLARLIPADRDPAVAERLRVERRATRWAASFPGTDLVAELTAPSEAPAEARPEARPEAPLEARPEAPAEARPEAPAGPAAESVSPRPAPAPAHHG